MNNDQGSIDVLAAIETVTRDPLPVVSPHHAVIVQSSVQVKRYLAENLRNGFVSALNEVHERGQTDPNELGNLGPNPARCGRIGATLDKLYDDIARLTSLLKVAEAARVVLEETGMRALDDAYEQSTRRIERGILPPDSYADVRRYREAHGEAVIQGRARAQKIRAEKSKGPKAAPAPVVQVSTNATPANDVSVQSKTGTHNA